MSSTWIEDLRHAMRAVLRKPLFGLTVIVTLGLGIGAATVMYAVLDAVVLRALPYDDPERLVTIAQRDSEADLAPLTINFPTIEQVRTGTSSFERVAAYADAQATLAHEDTARYLTGFRITHGFFATLGVRVALGRDFRPEEDQPDAPRVIILGHGLWQSMFGADPGIVGRSVMLGGIPRTVVGVLPATFRADLFDARANAPDIWVPLRYGPSLPHACRTCNHLRMIARLAPGASLDSARAELSQQASALRAAYAADYPPGMALVAAPAQERVVGPVSGTIWLVFGAVLLLLLVVCVNVGNLLLLRVQGRRAEFALRASLGMGGARLRRMLLVETATLVAIGGTVGIVLAKLAAEALARSGWLDLPRISDLRVDAGTLAVAIGCCALVATAASLAPLLGAARVDPSRDLHAGARTGTTRHGRRARAVSVALQLALACALSFGAVLIGRSFDSLLDTDPGFDPSGVFTLALDVGGQRYAEDAAVVAYQDALLARLRDTPGISSPALTSQLPMGAGFDRAGFHRQHLAIPGNEAPDVDRIAVSPVYFQALRVPLLAGRTFLDSDRVDTPRVALINERAAQLYFPDGNAVGSRIQLGGRNEDQPWSEIVGIVGDFHTSSGLDRPVSAQAFLAQAQVGFRSVGLVLRSSLPEADTYAAVRAASRAIDPGVALFQERSMADRVADTLARRRIALALFSAFAIAALTLCGLGVYAVVAQSVASHTHAIGVQRALGAADTRVLQWLLRQLRMPLVAGLVLGAFASAAWALALRSELFGIGPFDPASGLAVALLMLAMAASACVAPLRRAMRIAPSQALRQE